MTRDEHLSMWEIECILYMKVVHSRNMYNV